MYRVELKDVAGGKLYAWPQSVPNVPCGVESHCLYNLRNIRQQEFLMYRVELKGLSLEG